MKKISLFIIMILLTNLAISKNYTMEVFQKDIQKTVKIKTVKDGVVYTKKLYILKGNNKNNINSDIENYAFSDGNKFNSNSDLMIKFIKNTKIDIQNFSKKYNLKLKKKMNSGDYLFENINGNILNTIELIIKNEHTKIKRIFPNMILNMKPL